MQEWNLIIKVKTDRPKDDIRRCLQQIAWHAEQFVDLEVLDYKEEEVSKQNERKDFQMRNM